MAGLSDHLIWGCASAPADPIRRPAKVALTGVVLSATHHLGIGLAFQVVEDELQDIFLLTLFQGATSHIPGR